MPGAARIVIHPKRKMKKIFNEFIRAAEEICVLGHISPDGDCVGSTLAIRNYIRSMDPEKKVTVYLEEPSEKLAYLEGYREICTENCVEKSYDLCIVCDCGDPERTGKFLKYLATARKSFMIDHHKTNQGFCDAYMLVPGASSTCELVYNLLETEYLNREICECIYTGIIHDTGVFKYNSTTAHTHEVAGKCIETGIDFGRIIDDSFYSMTLKQRRLLGKVLTEIQETPDGRFVYSILDNKTMREFGIENSRETDGYVDLIRNTRGAKGGLFVYQIPDGHFKASLRSNCEELDVSVIAVKRGGGGHKMAAGCILSQDYRNDIREIIAEVEEQLDRK